MIMKIKILVMFLIFSCSVNTEIENSNSDIELPALRINQSFSTHHFFKFLIISYNFRDSFKNYVLGVT